eukprot:668770-Rhodomonas_salina.1
MWYKLSGLDDGGARGGNASDARCELLDQAEYPMWACDEGSMSVGALVVIRNNQAQTTQSTKEVYGRLTHFGDGLNDGVEMSGDAQLVGPHDHAYRGGWFLQYFETINDPSSWSSPKDLAIESVAIRDGSTLLLALAYPPLTTFTIQRSVSNKLTETFTAAATLAELRADTTATRYFFDGTYLYLKPFMLKYIPEGFGEDNLFVPDANVGWANDWTISATWDAGSGCAAGDAWCKAATNAPPAATVGQIAGQTQVWPCAVSSGPDWRIKSSSGLPSTFSGAAAPPPQQGSGETVWDARSRFTAPACNETRDWEQVFSELDAGGAETGGLGRLMQPGRFEVWVCFKRHPCPQAAGLSPTQAGMCYVYHEAHH